MVCHMARSPPPSVHLTKGRLVIFSDPALTVAVFPSSAAASPSGVDELLIQSRPSAQH